MRSPKPTHALAGVAALLSLPLVAGGCAAPTQPSNGMVAVAPNGEVSYVDPTLELAPYDLGRVDPEFTRVLGQYAADVRSIEAGANEPEDIRRALVHLAGALERIPGALPGGEAERAASTIRRDQSRIALGITTSRDTIAFADALTAASRALSQLARIEYDRAGLVRWRARGLRHAVRGLDTNEGLRSSQDDVVRTLRRAALVMTAMHAAAAEGLVD
jgi:hypothetical protein